MKTKANLSKYEDMYDTFDRGHDREHMEGVRDFAVKLAKKYCPDKIEVVYVSATLHDVGLSSGKRRNHAMDGYNMIKEDQEIKSAYSQEDFDLILEGIREHRASKGNPKSVVAKIISDSDRAYCTLVEHLRRSYEYNLQKYLGSTHEEVLDEVIGYMVPKFEEGGTGTRLYFEESKKRIIDDGKKIIEVCRSRDYDEIDRILGI